MTDDTNEFMDAMKTKEAEPLSEALCSVWVSYETKCRRSASWIVGHQLSGVLAAIERYRKGLPKTYLMCTRCRANLKSRISRGEFPDLIFLFTRIKPEPQESEEAHTTSE